MKNCDIDNYGDIETKLYEIHHSICNVKRVTICTWVYYNRNDDLCTLLNEKKEFTIKNTLVKSDVYFIRLIDKYKLEKIYINEIENEIEYIKTSSNFFDNSNKIIEYIHKEIGDGYSLSTFEYTWLIKSYMKITIDLYKFIIKLTINDSEEIVISSKKLKTFITSNKLKIIQAILKNNKIRNVKVDLNKKKQFERNLQEKNQFITYSSKKIGSNVKNASFYIHKSLKERYEVQAQKPFITDYEWNSL